jgi:hypothetical protein
MMNAEVSEHVVMGFFFFNIIIFLLFCKYSNIMEDK